MEQNELDEFKKIIHNKNVFEIYEAIHKAETKQNDQITLEEAYYSINYSIKINKIHYKYEKRNLKFHIGVIKFMNYFLNDKKLKLLMDKKEKMKKNNYEENCLEVIERNLYDYLKDDKSVSLADLYLISQSFDTLCESRKIIDNHQELFDNADEKNEDNEIALANLKNDYQNGIKILDKHFERIS